MNILQLNLAPSVNYLPTPPMPSYPGAPSVAPAPSKTYTVSLNVQFDTELEARAFARDILGIAGYEENL